MLLRWATREMVPVSPPLQAEVLGFPNRCPADYVRHVVLAAAGERRGVFLTRKRAISVHLPRQLFHFRCYHPVAAQNC
jgi:hypothetical protein